MFRNRHVAAPTHTPSPELSSHATETMPRCERILVATDLSARSDRALDRARSLLRGDQRARLVVLHVMEPVPADRYRRHIQSISALARRIRSRLAFDTKPCADRTTIRIEQGHPAEVIESVAREEHCDLIIVGVERVERFGTWTLGNTVARLLRRAHAPLLVVADRPRGAYRTVAIAVDFSKLSVETAELAASLFPTQRLVLFHAYQPLVYGRAQTAAEREHSLETARLSYQRWLATNVTAPSVRQRIGLRVELGDPARVLHEAADRGDFDLLVIGTRGHGRLFELLVGSAAKRILAELPCDALFVRGLATHG
jgi:nucleotide-binding universal stress UspA family protein